MKKSLTIISILISTLSFCQPNFSSLYEIKSFNISELSSDSLKIEYLNTIFKLDQEIRNVSSELELKYGRESKSVDSIYQIWRIVDSTLLDCIVGYVKIYGYPDKDFGEIPSYTPLLVIHHSNKTELKKELFPILYQAYLNDDIQSDAIYFLLYRMNSEMGFRPYQNHNLSELEQIEDLITRLNLNRE